jgi:arginine/ornithine N-succinyltransferase beta subunit
MKFGILILVSRGFQAAKYCGFSTAYKIIKKLYPHWPILGAIYTCLLPEGGQMRIDLIGKKRRLSLELWG